MQLADDGWAWKDQYAEENNRLFEKYTALLKEWNRFVPQYNAAVAEQPVKSRGRPLLASAEKIKDVERCHKQGISLREIAKGLGLSFRTVRSTSQPRSTEPI